MELCADLLVSAGVEKTLKDAVSRCAGLLDDGSAFERYCRMVKAQGGNPDGVLNIAKATDLVADQDGVISAMDTEALGLVIISLGGGRRKMGDPIDHSVGLEMLVRIGDRVSRGTPLVKIFSEQPEAVIPAIRAAIQISENGAAPELIVERIGTWQS